MSLRWNRNENVFTGLQSHVDLQWILPEPLETCAESSGWYFPSSSWRSRRLLAWSVVLLCHATVARCVTSCRLVTNGNLSHTNTFRSSVIRSYFNTCTYMLAHCDILCHDISSTFSWNSWRFSDSDCENMEELQSLFTDSNITKDWTLLRHYFLCQRLSRWRRTSFRPVKDFLDLDTVVTHLKSYLKRTQSRVWDEETASWKTAGCRTAWDESDL